MTLKKPICFSYRQYVELRDAYKQLLVDNQKLTADNRRLRDKLTKMEIAEWKYVEKDGNPKEMGTYYCLVVAPTEYNGKKIPHYEYDQRWFGEGETAQAWKMDGQPDSGLVWTEQTGSMEGEQVYAWRELPDASNCLVDPQAFERLCRIAEGEK